MYGQLQMKIYVLKCELINNKIENKTIYREKAVKQNHSMMQCVI